MNSARDILTFRAKAVWWPHNISDFMYDTRFHVIHGSLGYLAEKVAESSRDAAPNESAASMGGGPPISQPEEDSGGAAAGVVLGPDGLTNKQRALKFDPVHLWGASPPGSYKDPAHLLLPPRHNTLASDLP